MAMKQRKGRTCNPKIPAENHAGRKAATQVGRKHKEDESGDGQAAIAVHVTPTEVPHGGKCHSD